MATIKSESDTVATKGFKLEFTVPTSAQLASLRHTHRDRPAGSVASIRKATRGLKDFIRAVERGEMDLHDLPPDLRTKLALSLRSDGEFDDS